MLKRQSAECRLPIQVLLIFTCNQPNCCTAATFTVSITVEILRKYWNTRSQPSEPLRTSADTSPGTIRLSLGVSLARPSSDLTFSYSTSVRTNIKLGVGGNAMSAIGPSRCALAPYPTSFSPMIEAMRVVRKARRSADAGSPNQ